MYQLSFISYLNLIILMSGLLNSAYLSASEATFQIVESIPEGTDYGSRTVPGTQKVWLDMIESAKQNIDINAFYIANKQGSALSTIIDALIKRAQQGIKVRILVGSAFLKSSQPSIDRLSQIRNIEIRIIPMPELTGGVLHAKYMIVDNQTVFVGSQNWDWRALTQIHEIGARIDNARFAQTFTATFDFNWQLAVDRNMPQASKKAMLPLPFNPVTLQKPVVLNDANGEILTAFAAFSPPSLLPHGLTWEQPALVDLIEASQHRLRVQVMSLSAIKQYGAKGWWSEVDTALRDAAARGVDVRIIVADWSLHEPMQAYLKSLAVLPNITVKFSHVPPAAEGFIPYARVEHAKYVIADDNTFSIGTGNWESSYFNSSVDASVFVHSKAATQPLLDIFERDWNGSYVTTLEVGKTYQAARNN